MPQPGGNAPEGSQVCRDIVTRCPISPGCATGEYSTFVSEVYRQSIHFGFDNPLQLFTSQQSLDASHELPQLLLRVGVIQTQHGHQVSNRFEFLERFTRDPLSRRFGGHQFRELAFEVDKFPVEAIVLLVGESRLRQYVIGIIVTANLFAQCCVTLPGFLDFHPRIHSAFSRKCTTNLPRFCLLDTSCFVELVIRRWTN